MTELKPVCATLHPDMKNPCDGAIFCYAKDNVDCYVAELKTSHEVHEKYLTDAFKIREKALQDAADTKDACIERMKEKITVFKIREKALQDAADTKDACIERMKEKITVLEKNLWDLQRIPHTDNSAVIARLLEENKALKMQCKESSEQLQAFRKRYND